MIEGRNSMKPIPSRYFLMAEHIARATVSRGVERCPFCPDFPCEMLYEKQFPYGKSFLDLIGFFLNRSGGYFGG